ncbi:MAG: hypothetical protein ACT4PU_12480 [Planctomycetota bacterium]
MTLRTPCPSCRSNEVYTTTVDARGGYGPDLLPGLGTKWYCGPKLMIAACAGCGHVQFALPEAQRDKLAKAKKWQRL